jgi:hypothetical protein
LSPFASRSVRALSVLAAVSLVLAFALAVTLPPMATLAQLIARWRPDGVVRLEAAITGALPDWMWTHVALPVLGRPCWLLPVDFALVFGGIAVTMALRRSRAPERRRG